MCFEGCCQELVTLESNMNDDDKPVQKMSMQHSQLESKLALRTITKKKASRTSIGPHADRYANDL